MAPQVASDQQLDATLANLHVKPPTASSAGPAPTISGTGFVTLTLENGAVIGTLADIVDSRPEKLRKHYQPVHWFFSFCSFAKPFGLCYVHF